MMCLRHNWSVFKFVHLCVCPHVCAIVRDAAELADNKESGSTKQKPAQERELVFAILEQSG